ncbi:hypothetical protein CC80DRAFT_460606 [Byssothecium circinans]|uniref:Uncharacterized protein n=1 Tax=Byssothecium circinans TaxID=147558 RepID=A0A6A5UFJ5_9PLEO|nr:hypothetical protein CC80DRAFT_460606 [Byssothecium circinans]
MTKPKTRVISGPFDARHVGGVSIPGASVPIAGMARASTTLEPDETPSHTFTATGNIEAPRRSNTIAHSLSRPSLRLKTSMSLLRGIANPPDTHRKKPSTESADMNPVQSLRKKPSTSKLWQRVHQDVQARDLPAMPERPQRTVSDPVETTLVRKKSVDRFAEEPSTNPYEYHHQPQSLPPPPPPPLKENPSLNKMPVVRPKRADSGTAIDFNHVPVAERPLGFKEILTKSSYAERMELYKKTRDYWATADHGLGEWVEKAGSRRALVFPV